MGLPILEPDAIWNVVRSSKSPEVISSLVKIGIFNGLETPRQTFESKLSISAGIAAGIARFCPSWLNQPKVKIVIFTNEDPSELVNSVNRVFLSLFLDTKSVFLLDFIDTSTDSNVRFEHRIHSRIFSTDPTVNYFDSPEAYDLSKHDPDIAFFLHPDWYKDPDVFYENEWIHSILESIDDVLVLAKDSIQSDIIAMLINDNELCTAIQYDNMNHSEQIDPDTGLLDYNGRFLISADPAEENVLNQIPGVIGSFFSRLLSEMYCEHIKHAKYPALLATIMQDERESERYIIGSKDRAINIDTGELFLISSYEHPNITYTPVSSPIGCICRPLTPDEFDKPSKILLEVASAFDHSIQVSLEKVETLIYDEIGAMVEELNDAIKQRANVYEDDVSHEIFEAVEDGDLEYLLDLLSDNSDYANIPDSKGWTPLQRCVVKDQDDIAHFLIAHGADPNAVTPFGHSVLSIALTCESFESLLLLLNSDADIDRPLSRHSDITFRDILDSGQLPPPILVWYEMQKHIKY